MTEEKSSKEGNRVSRRSFLKTAAFVSAGLSIAPGVIIADPSVDTPGDPIRVGIIGAGGRGTGAAIDSMNADPNVVITAVADMFGDRVDKSFNRLNENHSNRIKAKREEAYTGFDGYKELLKRDDIDIVILAAPPHFRPEHLRASIEAGKHVFMEKPVAVDPKGIRSVISSSDKAKEKGLAIVAGTQRRHDPIYVETMRRIQDGAIGEITGGSCYWDTGFLWQKPRQPEWSDMEYQLRNWLYFDWLSGDHICEQHVHNIDVLNWAMGGPPVKAYGMGGRQVRTDPAFGNVFDHFAVEFEYESGARVHSYCRQIDGTTNRVSEWIAGSKGTANPHGVIHGENAWKHESETDVNPYVQEHADLIASIRTGEPLNEGRRIAESTLTAIIGRMSAYTGRALKFEWALNSSQLDLTPEHYKFRELAVSPVPVPGVTPLV